MFGDSPYNALYARGDSNIQPATLTLGSNITVQGGSGFVELQVALVTTWTGGLIETVTAYTDVDQARAAAERLAGSRSR